MTNKLLSTEEWAEAHGMHPASIRRALAEGRLEGFKVGKRWVIPADAELAPDKRIKSGNYIGVHPERNRKEKAYWFTLMLGQPVGSVTQLFI